VSVEYLVTGKEGSGSCAVEAKKEAPLSPESRAIIQCVEKLPDSDRKIILSTVDALSAALNKHK
jgi:hypothetical protein